MTGRYGTWCGETKGPTPAPTPEPPVNDGFFLPNPSFGMWVIDWVNCGHAANENIWLAFKGISALNYDTPQSAGIPANYEGAKVVNLGGGTGLNGPESITKANLKDVGNRAAELKNAGWHGVSFDTETLKHEWSSTVELVNAFEDTFRKVKAQGMFTFVTISHDGQTSDLEDSLPNGHETLLALTQMDGIDILSPQCYAVGDEVGTVQDICGWPWDSSGRVMKKWKAKYIIPSVGRKWRNMQADPLGALQAWTNWNPDSEVIGYIDWPTGKQNECAGNPTEGCLGPRCPNNDQWACEAGAGNNGCGDAHAWEPCKCMAGTDEN